MVSGKPAADGVTDMPETVYAAEVSVWRTIALGGLWISIWFCLHENNKPLFGGGFFIIAVQWSICCLVEALTGTSGHFTNEENQPETKLRTFQGRTDTQQGLNAGPSSSVG